MDRSFLSSLGRKAFCSKTALATILDELKDIGALAGDTVTSRSSIKRARDDDMDVTAAYGKLLATTPMNKESGGKPDRVDYVQPLTAFSHSCSSCDSFRTLVSRRLKVCPSSKDNPWNIIIYSDEIVAGDPLRHDNKRKSQAVYWSFQELGAVALSSEYNWFVLSTCRSVRVALLQGGMSGFMKDLLLTFFGGPISISEHGLVIVGVGVIFGKVGIHVSDESALKQVMQMKGASGLLPCVICPDTGKDSVACASTKVVPLHETDISNHTNHTDDTLRSAVQLLQSEHDTMMRLKNEKGHSKRKASFEKLQTALGLNYVVNGLLFCNVLWGVYQPISTLMYDWMHVYLVTGLWNLECGLVLRCIWKKLKIKFAEVHSFVSKFQWPGRVGVDAKNIFEKRSKTKTASGKKSYNISCSASGALSVYNVVRLFIACKVMPLVEDDDEDTRTVLLSYMLLCNVIDLLSCAADPIRLHDAIKQHLDKFLEAYGTDHWIPKHHMSIHLPTMLHTFGRLITCFVHERKHKEIKRYVPHKMSEREILLEVTALQLRGLNETKFTDNAMLVKPKLAPKNMTLSLQAQFQTNKPCYTAKEAVCATGLRVFQGDIITLFDGTVAEVLFHMSLDNRCISCVEFWSQLKTDVNMYSASSEAHFVYTCDIERVCVWRAQGSVAYVIPPAGFK